MQVLFGTDGVRGQANSWPMTPESILKLATAAAYHGMQKHYETSSGEHSQEAHQETSNGTHKGKHRFTIVIGKDTRLSGYMVESALIAGFVSVGAEVILLGPLPTPAVAMLTRSLRAQMGVMISASHNSFQDNGIKFFGPEGYKLTLVEEQTIETLTTHTLPLAEPLKIGKAKRLDDAAGRYIEFAKATFPRGQRLEGLKIVVDCANGAAYKVAPKVLWELGAEVIQIGVEPNGQNINAECGATNPHLLQQTVLNHKADLGIALDGDADRLLMVDENGQVLDGDQLMALIATLWLEKGLLKGQGIVATVMSNLGMERYLQTKGLTLHRTSVGDRFVLEAMQKTGCNVGGEQSGHILLTDYVTTGDGLIAALQILNLLQETREKQESHEKQGGHKKISQIAHVFEPVPQILKNLRTSQFINLSSRAAQEAIAAAEQKINTQGQTQGQEQGRLLVRASGTENLIRIMAQGDNQALLEEVISDLVLALKSLEKVA